MRAGRLEWNNAKFLQVLKTSFISDSPEFVYGMIIEQYKNDGAAMPIQSGSISGSLDFVHILDANSLMQQQATDLPVAIGPMTQESEEIPLSLMINPLAIDGGVQISNPISTIECENTTMKDQLNKGQLNGAEMDTFDADDLESISSNEEPVTIVVEAQVHREPSPYMDQAVQKKKSVSFNLSNMDCFPSSDKFEGKEIINLF
jgi:hypothetical protein